MKTKFLFLATVLFCLASCNNAEFDNSAVDLGGNSSVSPSGEDVYTIEIVGGDPATKGSAALQSLGIANLETDSYTKKPTAQLYKNGEKVSADYTWSLINSGGSYINLTNDKSQQAILTALKVKSQANLVHVEGTDGVGGKGIDVPVVVADNISVEWETKSMTLTSGEKAQKNTVVTNSKNLSVKVTRPSNCKLGISENNLGTSDITVTTGDDGKATVYVQYTGTSNTTLSLKAANGSHSAEATVNAKISEVTSISLTLVKSSVTVTESTTYKVEATYRDGTNRDITSEVSIYSTNSKGLSISGGTITTSKVDGCFGERNITVSYGGKTDTKAFTVESDFIWCAVYGSCYTGGWGSEILINGAVRKTDFVSNPQVAGPGVGDYGSVSGIKVTRIDVNTKYTPSGECTYVFNNDGLTSMKYPGDIETIQVYYYGQLVQTIKLKYSK